MLAEREVRFDGTCASALRATVLAGCDYLTSVEGQRPDCTRQLEPHMESAIIAVVRRTILEGLKQHSPQRTISPEMAATASWAIYGGSKGMVPDARPVLVGDDCGHGDHVGIAHLFPKRIKNRMHASRGQKDRFQGLDPARKRLFLGGDEAWDDRPVRAEPYGCSAVTAQRLVGLNGITVSDSRGEPELDDSIEGHAFG